MKIAFVEIKKEEQAYFKDRLKKHSLIFFEETANTVNPSKLKDVEILSPFIYSKVDADLISKMPKLKAVVTRSTGFDHVNLDECKKRGIKVGNVPFYGDNTVAEHTFALILSLSRNVHKSHVRTLGENFTIEGLQGFDLKGKTLGVIGVGHIGLHVIRIAKGFGMHVKAYDANKNVFISEVLHFLYTDLDDLLKNSDIISLHMPYNKDTHHFLDEKKLAKTKKGVIIINTARGGLIDTDALYSYLKKGHIGGAGLDVIEGEDIIKEEHALLLQNDNTDKLKKLFMDKQIFKMDNVIFTPHNAFNSREAVLRIFDSTIDNVDALTDSGEVKYKV